VEVITLSVSPLSVLATAVCLEGPAREAGLNILKQRAVEEVGANGGLVERA
jgi:hypothetical protein